MFCIVGRNDTISYDKVVVTMNTWYSKHTNYLDNAEPFFRSREVRLGRGFFLLFLISSVHRPVVSRSRRIRMTREVTQRLLYLSRYCPLNLCETSTNNYRFWRAEPKTNLVLSQAMRIVNVILWRSVMTVNPTFLRFCCLSNCCTRNLLTWTRAYFFTRPTTAINDST